MSMNEEQIKILMREIEQKKLELKQAEDNIAFSKRKLSEAEEKAQKLRDKISLLQEGWEMSFAEIAEAVAPKEKEEQPSSGSSMFGTIFSPAVIKQMGFHSITGLGNISQKYKSNSWTKGK